MRHVTVKFVLATLCVAPACYTGLGDRDSAGATGVSGSGGDTAGTDGTPSCTEAPQADFVPMRRLTRVEYENTIADLFGVTDVPTDTFPADESSGGFSSNGTIPVTRQVVEAYMGAAEHVAANTDVAALAPCAAVAPDAACADSFIRDVGRRVWRRPLTADESTALLSLQQGAAAGEFESGLRLVLEAMLQSSAFLYRPELGAQADANDVVALTSHELATRISFLLWASTPDDELLDAAESGLLDSAEGLLAQADRMMADPRFGRTVRSFHGQWLGIDRMEQVGKDPVLYPDFDPELAQSMADETLTFAEHVLLDGEGTLGELLTASYTFVDDDLAAVYGVTAPPGTGLRRVDLPEDQRAGVLTQPSFLTSQANADQASPILRGKFIRQRILCQVIPEPPEGVDITPPAVDPTLPSRERWEQHRTDPVCASCHSLMDPIGFSFGHYDAIGRWQDMDGPGTVDASGELTQTEGLDGPFDGALELAGILAGGREVGTCVTRQWLRFALGRPDRESEACSVETADAALVESGGNIRDMVRALISSDAFRYTKRSS